MAISMPAEASRPASGRTTVYLNLRFLTVAMLSSAVLVLLFANWDVLVAMELRRLCALATLAILVVVASTIFATPGDIWTPSSIYLGMLALFHFGAVAAYSVGQISPNMQVPLSRWFFSPWMPDAVVLAAMGVASCALGISLAGLNVRREGHSNPRPVTIRERSFRVYLTWIGCAMVIVGVGSWFAAVLASGGVSLLFGSYAQYLQATSGFPMSYVWLLLGLGLAFLSATHHSNDSRLHLLAYAIFGLFALFALPMGLRGEVMFTVLGALVVRARRGLRLSKKTTLAGALVLLVLISVIREVRQVGIVDAPSMLAAGSLFDGATELGASLRPLVEVQRWQVDGGDGQRGATYWAPIDRVLCRVSDTSRCLAAGDDPRLMNVVVAQRVGPIGFSPIAEAYENFRRPGVVMIMLVIGFLVGFMNKWRNTPLANAVTGLLMVELLINVRNAFTAVPAHLFLGAMIIVGAWVLSRVFPLGNDAPVHSPTMERALPSGAVQS